MTVLTNLPKPRLINKNHIHWDDSEWLVFAKNLHDNYPQQNYLHSKFLSQLTTTQLNATGALMPPGRQRSFTAIEATRKKLLQIFATEIVRETPFLPTEELPVSTFRKAPPPTPAPARVNGKNIVWTLEEWRAVTIELMRRHPTYLSDPELMNLTTNHVHPAQCVLPLERQRAHLHTAAIALIRPHIVKVLKVLLSNESEQITEEKTEQDSALETSEEMPSEEISPSVANTRIVWNAEDWEKIAASLHKQYPFCKYFENENLFGLTSADVAFAQRVLQSERQRPNLRIVSFDKFFRKPLLAAFKTLGQRLQGQAALLAAPVPEPTPAATTIAPTDSSAEPEQPVNEWEAVFRPLVEFLLKKAGGQLQPLITQMMKIATTPQVATPPTERAPEKSPFVAAAAVLGAVPMLAPDRAPAPKMTKPNVGVLCNRIDFVNELVRVFPHIEFIGIESGKKIDSIRNCIKVIVLTKFISHSNDRIVKMAVGERYVPVNGSVSECKRLVTGWMSDGILPKLEATTQN